MFVFLSLFGWMSCVSFVLAWSEVTVSFRLVACVSFGVFTLSVGSGSVAIGAACWSTLFFSAFLFVFGLGLGVGVFCCRLLTLLLFCPPGLLVLFPLLQW